MDSNIAEKINTAIEKSGLSPVKALTLAITNTCNLDCAHCWPESGTTVIQPPVSADRVKYIIETFVQLGIEELILTGGEPMTHPHWQRILQYCCTLAGLPRILLQTNGTLLTSAMARKLASPDYHKEGQA